MIVNISFKIALLNILKVNKIDLKKKNFNKTCKSKLQVSSI